MNEKAWIFLLRSARDREWPIAINVDQPKLLPEQPSDRVREQKGDRDCFCVLCAPCKKKGRGMGQRVRGREKMVRKEKNKQPVI